MRPPGDSRFLEEQRRQAVALVLKGHSVAQAAEAVGTTTRSVQRWLRAFREQGEDGLAARPVAGRPPKLDSKQETRLLQLLRKGPRACGFPRSTWEGWEIAKLIQRKFQVSYHPDSIDDLLKRIAGTTVRQLNRKLRADR